jgi:hypothetical protein
MRVGAPLAATLLIASGDEMNSAWSGGIWP